MSAWSSDFEAAPKDGTQILVRHVDWDCPAVMYWVDEDDTVEEPYWGFAEELLSEAESGILDIEGCQWAPIPG